MRSHAVIFDLGGVVVSWDPRRAYERVLPAEEVATFLERVDFAGWNRLNDGGRSFEEAEQELIARFPDDREAILGYRVHFDATLTGMVPGTSGLLAELGQAGVRLIALTNWSAETFPLATERFGILRRFEAIVVSGTEGLLKPSRRSTNWPSIGTACPPTRRSSSTTSQPMWPPPLPSAWLR